MKFFNSALKYTANVFNGMLLEESASAQHVAYHCPRRVDEMSDHGDVRNATMVIRPYVRRKSEMDRFLQIGHHPFLKLLVGLRDVRAMKTGTIWNLLGHTHY